ncbi:hypothetical protein VCR4J5_1270246 [Vibrio crassostreae]|uniref:Uncharacterized protein n=1 Tax=Vibrio crassostreae TaxID=246167 RepID=A0ABM9QMT6_9VIBR|nr:hypothetical protein VCR19J5_1200016 [Vibrio crassostreae]CDT01321.1 hypothetical protein VCR4J5_1270246 [Vibrio crassostreae]CDT46643.1 hypothetical protein VCR20J5_310081 [Vibrio crassostreae]
MVTVQRYDEESLSIDLFLEPYRLHAQSIQSTKHELLVG